MVIESQRSGGSVGVKNQSIAIAAGDSVAKGSGQALHRLKINGARADVRCFRVNGQTGEERRTAIQRATVRRNYRRRDEADVALGKNVIVVVGEIQPPVRLRRSKHAVKSIAAVVLLIADIGGVIAVFADVDGRAEIPPLCDLRVQSAFVALQMARADAGKCIVGIELLRIKAEADSVGRAGREANQCGVAVDLSEIITAVTHKCRAGAVRVLGHSHTRSTVSQRCRWSGEEGLDLQVRVALCNLAPLEPVSHIRADTRRELVFNFKGVDSGSLLEELIQNISNHVST